MTSHDVVAWLRKLLKMKRVGHGGTLDPSVAGVLPVALGKATRLLEYLLVADKGYRCEMVLGLVTSTQDLDGQILEKNPVTKEQLSNLPGVLKQFTGEIEQVPPMISAVRYQGKRLYRLAHQGIEVERSPRRVTIYQLKVLDTLLDKEKYIIRYDVTCSKGTYIRTLCHDIGRHLGCGASMSFLLRIKTGNFLLKDSYTLEEIQRLWEKGQKDFLLPMTDILSIPSIMIGQRDALMIMKGKQLQLDTLSTIENPYNGQKVQILDNNGLVAIGELLRENQGFKLQPRKVLR